MVNVLLALIALLSAAVQGNAAPGRILDRGSQPTPPLIGLLFCIGAVVGWFLTRGLSPTAINPLAWVFVSPWAHADPFHLATNICAILLIAQSLEPAIGRSRFAAVFATGSLMASIAHSLFSGPTVAPLAGASAGIHGLLTAHAIRFRHVRVGNGNGPRPTVLLVAVLSMLATVATAILLPESRLSALAHLIGAVSGWGAAWLLGIPRQQAVAQLREKASEANACGHHDLAIHLWRAVLDQVPEDLDAESALADACLVAGHQEAAARHVSAVLVRAAAQPNSANARMLLKRWGSHLSNLPLTAPASLVAANWLADAHEESKAIQVLSEVCQRFPGTHESETALLRIARIQLNNLRQPDSASAVLAEFLRLYPHSSFVGHARQLLAEASPTASVTGTAG